MYPFYVDYFLRDSGSLGSVFSASHSSTQMKLDNRV